MQLHTATKTSLFSFIIYLAQLQIGGKIVYKIVYNLPF